jgi:metal-dependent hydrolase (beta-lactamase superfamily II)
MKITIIYDNTAWDSRLTPDWGFSCLVEAHGKKILFDTGAKGDILLRNLKLLGIDPHQIDFNLIDGLKWICPTHCTRHIREIAARLPEKYIHGGAGKVIDC